MIISDSHKFVFHHVPKTGGSSITAALAPYCRNYDKPTDDTPYDMAIVPDDDVPRWQLAYHQPFWMHQPVNEYASREIPEGYFSFAFIRNPFEIVVSAWHSEDRDKFPYFDEYVDSQVYTGLQLAARWPQFDYLTDDDGKILVDYVGRYEKFAEDFYEVVSRIGVPLMIIPKRNVAKDKLHDSHRGYYSPVSRRLVEKKYEKDLEYFGYEF